MESISSYIIFRGFSPTTVEEIEGIKLDSTISLNSVNVSKYWIDNTDRCRKNYGTVLEKAILLGQICREKSKRKVDKQIK